MRLGGIYALEGVMNTSKEYHQPVLEALSVFVRDATRSQKEVADRPSADRRFDSSFTALRLNCDDQGRLLARLGLFLVLGH